MKAAFGAVGGALAVGALLVSYDLGARNAFNGQMSVPATQMVIGPDGIARPYLVQAGQTAFGQALPGQPYGWSPYGTTTPGAVAPLGYAAYPAYQPAASPVQTQYVTERAVTQPVRRVSSQRVVREVEPRRSWQKSALLIGGSAGAGAGLGAVMGGKKGALAGAAIGGGAAAIYDQVKRH
jgi:hypothetical protein